MTTQSFSKGVGGVATALFVFAATVRCAQASTPGDAAPRPQTGGAVAAQAAKPAAEAPAKAPADAEKAVRARVEEYWKTRSTMNLQNVQPFYEPDFRTKYPPDAFARDFRRLNRFAPEFLGIESVALEDKKATVKVKLRTKPDVLQGQELISVVEEVWLNLNGGWFRQAEALLPNL